MTHIKKLIENFLSLSFLKAADYILPLIAIPYLVRVLGPANFGLVAFVQAFVEYFVIFTDYGFGFTATKEISIHRDDKNKINEIFSAVISAKVVFAIFSFLVFALIVFSFGLFKQYWPLYLFTFGAVVGKVMFPQWFFQGMEKMKYITIAAVTARLLSVIFMFVFVRSANDYLFVAFFYSFGFIFAGIIGLFVSSRYFDIKYIMPSLKSMIKEIKNGYYVFIGMIANSLYTTSNIFILGLLTNNTIVGYYSAGEKIAKAIQALFNPVSQTVFPHISSLVKTSKGKALRFVRKVTIISGIATFIISLLLFIFAPIFVKIMLGDEYLPTIMVLRILSFLPFMCSLGNIFGTQLMINFGMTKIFARIIVLAGIFNVVLALILIPIMQQNGIAIAVLCTEILITLAMFIILEIKELSPRKKWIDKYDY